MRKQKLLSCLEQSREVINACIHALLHEKVCEDDMQEGVEMLQQLLLVADDALRRSDSCVLCEEDELLYNRCVALVIAKQKASASLLQRHLRIGYGRAALMMDAMVNRGVISPSLRSPKRHMVLQ